MTAAAAEATLRHFLSLLDEEDWEQLVDLLDDDVQLADELTSTWLRGRDEVAAYLRASAGIVTDIQSIPAGLSSRRFGQHQQLLTFTLRQHYKLDGIDHHRQLTGCATFRDAMGSQRLSLFHLGEAAPASTDNGESTAAARPDLTSATARDTLGQRIRVQRTAKGLSLRGLAESSGVSASFISQLERSQAGASVATLRSIADALGTTSADLLGEHRTSGTVRTGRHDTVASVRLHELGLRITPFPGLRAGQLESWIAEVSPGAPGFSPVGGSTKERFIYVLEGTVDLVGPEAVTLNAGEGAHLRSADFRIAAHGTAPALYLCTQVR